MDWYKYIHTNPVGGNGFYRYDVVYLGKVIPSYRDNEVSRYLQDQYVFVFSTYLNPKDEERNGRTDVSIEEEYKISHFADEVIEQTHFHTITDEKSIFEIHDSLEIHIDKLEKESVISAVLKNQPIYNNKNEFIYRMNKKILLVREDLKFDNVDVLSLGKEFANQVKLDWYKKLGTEIEDCIFRISSLESNTKNEQELEAIATVSKMLKEKYSGVEKMENAYTKIKYGQLY